METFSSLVFVFCVLPFVVLMNAFLRVKAQNFVVLIFSLAFLFWVCSAVVAGLLFFVSVFTQLMAIVVCEVHSKRLRFFVCLATVVLEVVLVCFSFCFVFANVFSNLFFDFERILFSLVVMANLSYLVDVYKKYAVLQKSFINFLTYVFMFPKLFLGPVLIYYKFERQLVTRRRVSAKSLSEGIEYFILGFAKKVVFANEFYEIYGFVVAQTFSSLPVFTAWLGAVSGFLSLVFNFSGYNDMAIGLAKMLGFNFPMSVKNLFFVSSVSEFFRRFNFLVLNYLKNYLFPWKYREFCLCRFLKVFFVGFFVAIFFGGRIECFVAAMFFSVVVLLESFFSRVGLKTLKNSSKFLTFVLLIVGTVLFQKSGLVFNFSYLGSMIGMSGVLVDFSFIFLVMTLKFSIIVFVTMVYRLFKQRLVRIQFFNLVYSYFKFFGLIVLFLFSVLLSLSQI